MPPVFQENLRPLGRSPAWTAGEFSLKSWRVFGSATILIIAVGVGSGLFSYLLSGDLSRQHIIAELEGEFTTSPGDYSSGYSLSDSLAAAGLDPIMKSMAEDRLIVSLVEKMERGGTDFTLLDIEYPSERKFHLRFVFSYEDPTEVATLKKLQEALDRSLKSSYRLKTQLGEFSLSVSPTTVTERFGAPITLLFFGVLIAGFAIVALMLGSVLSHLSRPRAAFSEGFERRD